MGILQPLPEGRVSRQGSHSTHLSTGHNVSHPQTLSPQLWKEGSKQSSKTAPPLKLSGSDTPSVAQIITHCQGDKLLSTREDVQMH